MYLSRLIYASKISDQFKPADLENILAVARENNTKNHVTGILCFNRKYFLQCLEGGRQQLNETFVKIARDTRHCDLQILQFSEVTKRVFPKWEMSFVPESSLTKSVLLGYSPNGAFDPFQMSGQTAIELLVELKNVMN